MDSNDEASLKILKPSKSLKQMISIKSIGREFFPEEPPLVSLLFLEKYIHIKFKNYYYHDKDFYNIMVINDIISNESTHIVAEFKDYLIMGDDSEFLQKYYSMDLSKKYLPKIFDYYKSCSVIFPNYVILPESKYIYKNIQKKQRVIDIIQEQEEKNEEIKNRKYLIEDNDDLFTTGVMYSILGQTNTSYAQKIFGIKNEKSKNEKNDNTPLEIIDNIEKEENKQKNKISKKKIKGKNNSAHKKNLEINLENVTYLKENKKKISKENTSNITNININLKKSNNLSINKNYPNYNAYVANSNKKINVNKILVNYKKHRYISTNINNNNGAKSKIDIIKNNLGISNNNFEKTHLKQNTISNTNIIKQSVINNYFTTNNINFSSNKKNGNVNQYQINAIISSRSNLSYKKNVILKMLFNNMKLKNKTQRHQTCKKINFDIKTNPNVRKHKKNNTFSLSPPSPFITIISRLNKRKKIFKRPFNNKQFINNSNSANNIDKKNTYNTISVKDNNYNFLYNNNNNISSIPTHNHTESNVDKNNNNNIIFKDNNKNNYCTIVPQVLNMLNLNIYKINSFHKAQKNYNMNNSNYTNKTERNQAFSGKKIYISISDNIKKNGDNKKTLSKNKKSFNNKNNNVPLTSRKFSPINLEENSNVKNNLPTSGSFGTVDPKKSILNDQINKKKNTTVLPGRKNLKNNILINKINTKSSSKNDSSNSKNKKKKSKNSNLNNIKTDCCGKDNIGSSINSICSVKSMGHSLRLKNKKSPSFCKPSINFILNNK